jgi:hypothetical protein
MKSMHRVAELHNFAQSHPDLWLKVGGGSDDAEARPPVVAERRSSSAADVSASDAADRMDPARQA